MTNQIPVTYTVQVNISLANIPPAQGDFGTLNVMGISDVISVDERIRTYDTIDEVGSDFPTSSEEYKAAETLFAQNPHPASIKISRRVPEAVAGFLTTSNYTPNLPTMSLIDDGEFTISIDGDSEDIIGLDFTAVTNYDDIAAVIQTGLQAVGSGGFLAATCANTGGHFVITSGSTGTSSSVSLITPVTGGTGTDITTTGTLNLALGVATPGYAADTSITDSLEAVYAVDNNWFGLAFTKEMRDSADVIEAAEWVEDHNILYATVTNDPDTYDQLSTTDIAAELQADGFTQTETIYHDQENYYLDVGILSIMLTVNWNGLDTTKTQNNQQIIGIPAANINSNQLSIIQSKNCNTIIKQKNVSLFVNGKMANGQYFDTYQGMFWLQDTIQTNVLAVLVNPPNGSKVPYTDSGMATIEKALRQSLQQGVNNGYLSPLINDDGSITPAYTTTVPRVADVPVSQRVTRIAGPFQFTGQLANAIHRVQIVGILED